jgi:hypothetical protein
MRRIPPGTQLRQASGRRICISQNSWNELPKASGGPDGFGRDRVGAGLSGLTVYTKDGAQIAICSDAEE